MSAVDMTEPQFRELFNHVTPARIVAAARLVRTGITVTLSQTLRTEASIAVPKPADHHMTMLTDVDRGVRWGCSA